MQNLNKDHFIKDSNSIYAGRHIILDIHGANPTDLASLDRIQDIMQSAIIAAKATLLHIHLHHFGEGYGVSGVAVLAESHISVHTWPEKAYAAFDVFMCGDAKPEVACEVIRHALPCESYQQNTLKRGVINERV